MQFKRSLVCIGIVVIAIAIAVVVSGTLMAPQPGSEQPQGAYKDGDSIRLSGELQCLPHRDQSGPQTMECAYGFRDESGTYYALEDATENYSLIANMPMNEPVQIEGTYRTNSDTKYQQNGTIEATAITR